MTCRCHTVCGCHSHRVLMPSRSCNVLWKWPASDTGLVSREADGYHSGEVQVQLWALQLTSKTNWKPQSWSTPEYQDISILLTLYEAFQCLAINSHKPAENKGSPPPLLTSTDVSFLHTGAWVSLGRETMICSPLGKRDSHLLMKKKKYTSKSCGNTWL